MTSPATGLRALLGYFLGLGTWGFDGPIATVGYMRRDLVERHGRLDHARPARHAGRHAVVQSLFYGIAPAVIAIIVIATAKLARLTNQRDPRLCGPSPWCLAPSPR
jgi:chromate transporter